MAQEVSADSMAHENFSACSHSAKHEKTSPTSDTSISSYLSSRHSSCASKLGLKEFCLNVAMQNWMVLFKENTKEQVLCFLWKNFPFLGNTEI